MALNKQLIPINIGQGLDTKADPKKVVPGKLLEAQNVVFTTPGLLRKRNGYNALSKMIQGGSSTISDSKGLATFKNELLMFSSSDMYSYSESTDAWVDKGEAVHVNLSVNPVVRNTYKQSTCDIAYHSIGLKVFTWEDSRGGSRYSVIDSNTGQAIVNDAVLSATAQMPKPFALGNYIIISYRDTGDNHLKIKTISALTPTLIGSAMDISTNFSSAAPLYDGTVIGSRLFFVYNNVDGTHISGKYVNNFLTFSAEVDLVASHALNCITAIGDSVNQNLFVSYNTLTTVAAFTYDYSLTLVFGEFTVQNIADILRITGRASNGNCTLYYEKAGAFASQNYIIKSIVNETGTVTSNAALINTVGLASKVFYVNNTEYFLASYASTLQPTYFLIDSFGKIVSKVSPGQGQGALSRYILPEAVSIGTNLVSTATQVKDLFTTVSGTVYTQTGVQEDIFNFDSTNNYLSVQLANNLHVSGGTVYMYDGASFVEHGFHVFPEGVTAVGVGGGGSLSAGNYQYSVCYEWTDAQGQIHRSAPSVPVTVPIAFVNDSATVTIPYLGLTAKSNVSLVVYRTEANGTIFYRDSSVTSPISNNTFGTTVTFTSTQADTALIGNPLLYTTGGVVEDIAPPAADSLTTYRNRAILVPSEDKLSFWYSKQAVAGSPVEFSDIFVQKIDSRGGNITAVSPMDDKLILFKRSSIFVMQGDGPDSAGGNNDFTEAQLVTTDGGSMTPFIGVTPIGLMYKSEKGIYLLDRSLSTKYIGAPVERYNSANLTSIQLVPNTNQVRFTLDSGIALVYDYFVNEWSVFTSHDAASAVIFDERFTYVNSLGQVYQEDPSIFTDAGQFIPMKFTTSWLSLAQLQGYQRVYRLTVLGNYVSKHRLMVSVAYDFNPSATQQTYIDAGTLLDTGTYGDDSPYGSQSVYGGAFPLYEFQVNLAQQKCTSIQFTIQDVAETPYGEALSVSSLGLIVGAKSGFNKLPASRRFG